MNAHLHTLLSVALDGEKARGQGGVVYIDMALKTQYALPEDFLASPRCGKDFVDQLRKLISTQRDQRRVVVVEEDVQPDTSAFGAVWSLALDPEATVDGWHHSPSLRAFM